MSAEKHQQLIDEGKLHPDGTRIEVCPTCQRELPHGEHLPEPATVATAEAVVADTATGEV